MTKNFDGPLFAVGIGMLLWLLLAVQAMGIWLGPHQQETLVEQCAALQASSR